MTQSTDTGEHRIERDTMGEVRVPAAALWKAQTQRAVENFPISGIPINSELIAALGLIKEAAAKTNAALGVLRDEYAAAIEKAAGEVAANQHDAEFPIDVFQTGSGTSSNMNANEVIASLASAQLGEAVHPNDHVNASQSSNDVFPSAIHIAATYNLVYSLLPALRHLESALSLKATEFAQVVKSGRTHLMDATPVTLGQEFGGYAAQIGRGIERVESALPRVAELPLGGTAVGTGINTPAGFAESVISMIADKTGLPLTEARDHFEAQGARDGLVEASGVLRTIAVSLHQDRQRPALDGLGPTGRARRDHASRPAARILDHAGQGQPGHLRGDAHGLRSGDRQRRCGRLCGGEWQLRAQRHASRHGAQHPGVDPAIGQCEPAAGRPLRGRASRPTSSTAGCLPSPHRPSSPR